MAKFAILSRNHDSTLDITELGFDSEDRKIKQGTARMNEVLENLLTRDKFGAISNPHISWSYGYASIVHFNKNGCQVHTPRETKIYDYDYKTHAERAYHNKEKLGIPYEEDPRVILASRLAAYASYTWVNPPHEMFAFDLPNEPSRKAVLEVRDNLPWELRIYDGRALNVGKIDNTIRFYYTR